MCSWIDILFVWFLVFDVLSGHVVFGARAFAAIPRAGANLLLSSVLLTGPGFLGLNFVCVSLKPGPKAECLVLCKAFVQYQGHPNVFRVHFGLVEVPPIMNVAAASPSRYLFLLFVDVVDGSVVFGVIASRWVHL